MWYNLRCNLCGKYVAHKDRPDLMSGSLTYNSAHKCSAAHEGETLFFTAVSKSKKFIADFDYFKVYPVPFSSESAIEINSAEDLKTCLYYIAQLGEEGDDNV